MTYNSLHWYINIVWLTCRPIIVYTDVWKLSKYEFVKIGMYVAYILFGLDFIILP